MQWLRDLSIRSRLISIVLFSIVVFCGFGIFTIIGMNRLGTVTSRIYEDPLTVSNAAVEARVNIIKIQRAIKGFILSPKDEAANEEMQDVEVLGNRVLECLNIIKQQAGLKENQEAEKEVRELFLKWRKSHEQVYALVLENRQEEAASITRLQNSPLVEQMDAKLMQIDYNAQNFADSLVLQARQIEKNLRLVLILLIIGLGIMFTLFVWLNIRSILRPIEMLKAAMNRSTVTGKLEKADLAGDNEITEMSKFYNLLVQKLENQFWIKDNQNLLNHEMSGTLSLDGLTQRALNLLARELNAGKGTFYLYDPKEKSLHLHASFAFTQREHLSNCYRLGEGIIGQVALEKKPILLKNINKQEMYIETGVLHEAPLNVYTFPLIHEAELYGVIELASFEPFDELKQEFLNEGANIVAINLYSAIQNQKVKDLLAISEEAQREARTAADQLKRANRTLEEQQVLLQQQTEELQKTNAELEEQQQQLQQQSEELQQTNSQLEEQQQQLEEQSVLLNKRNRDLEISRGELQKRSKQLEISNKYKSEFLANMSHELRTPLNSIILLSRLLMRKDKDGLGKENYEKINVIYNSGQELLRLINDILDLSKIEAGKMDINQAEFHTKALATELRQLFESIAQEKKIEFNVVDELNAVLSGDRDKISQILRNFISNAIKFTEKGSVSLRIMADKQQNNRVKFSVTDTGIGVSEENMSRIFQEFQQGDGSISRKFGGTGLGLSISKKLAELLGGEIQVSSKVGEGSTFTLYLKDSSLLSKENYAAKEYTDALQECAAATSESNFVQKSEKVILIIEDDENFANHIMEMNKAMGFDTIVGKSGKEGLHYAKEYPVDGILLDLMLPDMSGIDVLRELKRTAALRKIPVHVISAKDKNNLLQKMGAIGYQQKPVEEQDLVESISKLVDFSNKKQKQLLIIEDNEAQRKAMEALISGEDVQIQTAGTEEEAILEIDKGIYDAIILDLGLGSGDGINICKYIEEKKLETPVIVYTGSDLTVQQEKEIRKYTDSIIIKTANSDARLLDEVTLFLHQVKKREERDQYLLSKTNKDYALRLDGKKILIVDDDPRNLFVLATALEEYGAEILEAENGEAALKKLNRQAVDLILMDVMMPVMDGLETMKKIREDKSLQNIPIIAITAKSLKEDRAKCIAAGANDYVSKPVDYDVLIRLVKAWINK
ncbi:response regulator [Geosporobacter ferrireducens]|uniref:Circadian input-output histidine kinase CikA n=1 Tax=Geosporobacter ferrireducens TaxID=1424294 RepID=A0A1D8GIN3_9FIRM|nr:response regulator [Geosporobacter ferrireducens]AOT70774.1 hypothetical protein Gferi_15040 [Geosporobacter ferrireducens]MTI57264.1 response regulator [Geosporobacter ferrireducens]